MPPATFLLPANQLASHITAIYKYVAIRSETELNRACAMISDRSLWFWHVTGQNDPRECQPIPFFGGNYGEVYDYFLTDFTEAFPHLPPHQIDRLAYKAARNPRIPRPDMVYRWYAICCFSAANSCPVLWRDYGGDESGIMLEYPTEAGTSTGLACKVNYTDEPVRLNLLRLDYPAVHRVFTTKTKRWAHEREYRMIERLRAPFSGGSFRYGDLAITSVTLGARLPECAAAAIRRTCDQHNIPIRNS